MNRRAVAKVLIDPAGHLFVVPELEFGATYEHIYREANGLRWHGDYRAIHAYEPERWEPLELMRHIASTLRETYDEELRLTSDTKWEGVPLELQARLRSTLAAAS